MLVAPPLFALRCHYCCWCEHSRIRQRTMQSGGFFPGPMCLLPIATRLFLIIYSMQDKDAEVCGSVLPGVIASVSCQ